MLTSEELFPPEYCFVGRCSSHLAPFLPPPLHHRHSLLLSLPPRRHCFNETGKCNLFVLPSPRRKRGYPRFFLLSLQYPFPRFSPPEAPARLVSPCHASLSRRRSVPLSPTSPRVARGNFQIIFTPPLPRGDSSDSSSGVHR